MLLDLLVGVIFGVLNAVLGLIPTFDIITEPQGPTGLTGEHYGWTQWLAETLRAWNDWLPITEVLYLLMAVFATKAFIAVVQFIRWVWDRLPAKGT